MEKFNYSYSADKQEEIKRIREKYLPCEDDKMELIRKLDNNVTKKSTAISLTVGIIGTMMFGIGMCCCLVWTELFIFGIIIGMFGIILDCMTYPLYNYILKKERKKIAPEIIKLTDELMK